MSGLSPFSLLPGVLRLRLMSTIDRWQGPILFDFKKDIEDRQELEKWQRTVKGIEARSGNKYPISALQKKFKESTKVGDVAFAVKDGE